MIPSQLMIASESITQQLADPLCHSTRLSAVLKARSSIVENLRSLTHKQSAELSSHWRILWRSRVRLAVQRAGAVACATSLARARWHVHAHKESFGPAYTEGRFAAAMAAIGISDSPLRVQEPKVETRLRASVPLSLSLSLSLSDILRAGWILLFRLFPSWARTLSFDPYHSADPPFFWTCAPSARQRLPHSGARDGATNFAPWASKSFANVELHRDEREREREGIPAKLQSPSRPFRY